MFEQFQILLYIVPAILVTFIAFRKGKLNSPKENTLKVLTVVGVVLPWIDVLETAVGFEYDGNAFLLGQYNLSPLFMTTLFVLSHFLLSILAFTSGKSSRKPENIVWKFILVFLDAWLVILVIMNAVNLYLWTRH